MQLHQIQSKTPRLKSARVGRGGKRGKTSGRGTKGQLARSGNKPRPEMRDIIKKLPKRRGRGISSLTSFQPIATAVNVTVLDAYFAAGDTVTPMALKQKGVVNTRAGKLPIVKILATGELTKKLSIEGCLVSEAARQKIEAVGGQVK